MCSCISLRFFGVKPEVSGFSFLGSWVPNFFNLCTTVGPSINVSSISGIVAGHNFAAYNSAKAAVRHLTKSVALHCARTTDLVRCNSVHPVFAKTEMMKSFFENPTDELISKIEKQIPVRKLVTVEDVANSILFLASDESKMITGSEIVIDGGLSAQ